MRTLGDPPSSRERPGRVVGVDNARRNTRANNDCWSVCCGGVFGGTSDESACRDRISCCISGGSPQASDYSDGGTRAMSPLAIPYYGGLWRTMAEDSMLWLSDGTPRGLNYPID